ncbi:MAG: response regulator transcription factor [Ignavibacteriales bacterium]|nr:response regulator transcription factor [Ignavibacteriales bacterium]
MKILLVEDEKKVASFIKKGLEEEYYSVDVAEDGKAGLDYAFTNEYDLFIFDVMLPYKNGISIVREIRSHKITTPILLLTAKDRVEDKVEGLDAGADDYLTKPFAFEELLARIRSLLRRKEREPSIQLKAADLILDTQTHKVTRNNREIVLTPREYAILEYLLRNKNKVISRTKLTEHVYDYHFDPQTNVIEVYINKLRNKINKDYENQLLYTVRGIGYIIKDSD